MLSASCDTSLVTGLNSVSEFIESFQPLLWDWLSQTTATEIVQQNLLADIREGACQMPKPDCRKGGCHSSILHPVQCARSIRVPLWRALQIAGLQPLKWRGSICLLSGRAMKYWCYFQYCKFSCIFALLMMCLLTIQRDCWGFLRLLYSVVFPPYGLFSSFKCGNVLYEVYIWVHWCIGRRIWHWSLKLLICVVRSKHRHWKTLSRILSGVTS